MYLITLINYSLAILTELCGDLDINREQIASKCNPKKKLKMHAVSNSFGSELLNENNRKEGSGKEGRKNNLFRTDCVLDHGYELHCEFQENRKRQQ